MKNENTPTNSPLDFYFWLGADGEAESMTLEEFEAEIAKQEELLKKWREVDDDSSN